MPITLDRKPLVDQGIEGSLIVPRTNRRFSLADELPDLGTPFNDHRQPEQIFKAGHFRRISALQELANDLPIALQLGEAGSIFAYGESFPVRTTQLKLRVKDSGTGDKENESRIVPVHFYSKPDGLRHKAAHARSSNTPEHTLEQIIGAQAWFDDSPDVGAIEVVLGCDRLPAGDGSLVMSAARLKGIFSVLEHELAHVAGGGEFVAFRRQLVYAKAVGLIARVPSNLEIIRSIDQIGYDFDSMTRAVDEFYQQASPEELERFFSV